MTKYYFSKTKDIEEAAQSSKAIIMDGQKMKFYKNGVLNTSLTFSGIVRAKRMILENLPNINTNTFSRFFTTEDNHSTDNNHLINAFAYLRSNNINNVDSINRWPK